MEEQNVIVVGAGAAGLIAAGAALQHHKKVTLIEKNARPARKVMITGKGRCNVTNACTNDTFMQAVVSNPRFLYSALQRLSPYDTMNLLEHTLGVPLKTERGNRVFPVSDKAVDIVDALVSYAAGANQRMNTVCTGILKQGSHVIGVELQDGERLLGSSVIVTTGGLSYPATGSTGDGYDWAVKLGHTIIPTGPSLVPVESDVSICRDLMGLSLKNVRLSIFNTQTKKCIFSEIGEMLFTHFGLSGPLILSASAHMRPMKPDRYEAVIDLKPGLNEQQLDARLLRDFQDNVQRTFHNSLGKLLPRALIPVIVRFSGIPKDTRIPQITKVQRHKLLQCIKQFTLPIKGFRPVEEAVVTAGGIAVQEIDPKTMESKYIKGLYFAGEILDLDAYTGGFNLQIAFSTGYAAGIAAQ